MALAFGGRDGGRRRSAWGSLRQAQEDAVAPQFEEERCAAWFLRILRWRQSQEEGLSGPPVVGQGDKGIGGDKPARSLLSQQFADLLTRILLAL